MVEMEASWEFSECRADGVEGGRSIMGGVGGDSLPPRKRLLAGLRQNGWVSSLPGMVVSPGTEGFTHGVGEKGMPAADGEGKDGMVGELIKKRAALGVIAWRATVNCRESSMWLSIYGCASLVSYFTIRVCFAPIALLCIMMQVC
jgi:hypothetical protein